MTTITKERLLTIKQWRETYGPGSNVVLPAEEAEELARIALASLEAKPIGAFHIAEQQVDGTSDYIKDGEWPIDNGIIEVYAAPPVPVVPEEKPMPNPLSMYAVDAVSAIAEVRGWNACRAAMLHGAEPVSQTYKLNELSGNSPVTPDGWISCSERMPEIRQTVMGWNGYAVRQCVYTRNGYAKTQKGREPRFETSTGIWHGVTHWMPLPEPPQEVNRG
ncbi:DUF551 domain-containing protein [Escherichia coli]|uniref:DUF551 domain-containing protein n=1 Tax=Escherichia coli TaxID=562 RepID=UPI001C4084CF|nr:DUF551 domain-containing protein [Escherichia coli]